MVLRIHLRHTPEGVGPSAAVGWGSTCAAIALRSTNENAGVTCFLGRGRLLLESTALLLSRDECIGRDARSARYVHNIRMQSSAAYCELGLTRNNNTQKTDMYDLCMSSSSLFYFFNECAG